jgi:hypothetical protein
VLVTLTQFLKPDPGVYFTDNGIFRPGQCSHISQNLKGSLGEISSLYYCQSLAECQNLGIIKKSRNTLWRDIDRLNQNPTLAYYSPAQKISPYHYCCILGADHLPISPWLDFFCKKAHKLRSLL